MSDSDGEKTVRFLGKNLYHEKQPRRRAEAVAEAVVLQEKCLVVVPSPLLGYGLDVLVRRLPESSRILCIEREETLMAIALESIPNDLVRNPRVHFVRTDAPEGAAAFVEKTLGAWRFRKVQTVALNRGYSIHDEFYRKSASAILDLVQVFWRNKMTSVALGRLWMKNILLNLSLLPGSKSIEDLRFAKPLVLTGAGESLETSLELIVRSRDRIQVLTVDTALPALLAAGVRPDFIVAAEAQFANQYDFIGLGDWSIPVIADLTSYPGVARRFSGDRFFFLSRFSELSWFGEAAKSGILPPLIPPLGSVGVMALHLAGRATPPDHPIFLAGFDFSYSPGKPHSRGAPSHVLALAGSGRLSRPRYLSAWFDRPKTSALRKDGSLKDCDAVLASYRTAMRDTALSRGNVFDLGKTGLDLGIPIVKNETEFRGLIPPARGEAEAEPRSVRFAGWSGEAVRDFYENLLEGLEEGARVLREAGSERDEFLAKYDFITIDFPDVPPLPPPDPSFAKRCALSADWYRRRVLQGMELLSTLPRS